jgi:hypothetical protein
VDGYEVIPRTTKEVQRSFYTALPTQAQRAKVDADTKRLLRQWYRKYPTLEQQQQNPFNDFAPTRSLYQIARDHVQIVLSILNFKVWSKTENTGNIAAKHYMPILQQLTTWTYQSIMRGLYGLPGDYDFAADPLKLRSKRVKYNTEQIFSRSELNGKKFLYNRVMELAPVMFTKAIPDIIGNINARANAIVLKIAPVSDDTGDYFAIEDYDVLNSDSKAVKKASRQEVGNALKSRLGEYIPPPSSSSSSGGNMFYQVGPGLSRGSSVSPSGSQILLTSPGLYPSSRSSSSPSYSPYSSSSSSSSSSFPVFAGLPSSSLNRSYTPPG